MSIQRAIEILETKADDTMRYAAQFRGDKDAEPLMRDLAKAAKGYRESADVLKASIDYLKEITEKGVENGTKN